MADVVDTVAAEVRRRARAARRGPALPHRPRPLHRRHRAARHAARRVRAQPARPRATSTAIDAAAALTRSPACVAVVTADDLADAGRPIARRLGICRAWQQHAACGRSSPRGALRRRADRRRRGRRPLHRRGRASTLVAVEYEPLAGGDVVDAALRPGARCSTTTCRDNLLVELALRRRRRPTRRSSRPTSRIDARAAPRSATPPCRMEARGVVAAYDASATSSRSRPRRRAPHLFRTASPSAAASPSTASGSSRPTSAAASASRTHTPRGRSSSPLPRAARAGPVKWIEDRREDLLVTHARA